MTYKEIVDRVRTVVSNHKMLADFGYGNLSDINADEANYPYAFLNPTNHARNSQSVSYRFNLIVMDMVKNDDFLKIQSECQQYIDDILAHLRFGYTDQVDLNLSITLTPFKERFQDEVAGMTATLEIEIPNRLSDCYNPIVVPFEPIVVLNQEIQNNLTPASGFDWDNTFVARSYGLGPYFYSPTSSVIVDGDGEYIVNDWNADYISRGSSSQNFYAAAAGTYRLRFEALVANMITQADIDAAKASDPTTWTDPSPAVYLSQGPNAGTQTVIHTSAAWPFTTAVDEQFTFVDEFEFTYDGGADSTFNYFWQAQPDDFGILSRPTRFFNTKMTITKIA